MKPDLLTELPNRTVVVLSRGNVWNVADFKWPPTIRTFVYFLLAPPPTSFLLCMTKMLQQSTLSPCYSGLDGLSSWHAAFWIHLPWSCIGPFGLASLHLSWNCIGLFPRVAMDSFPGSMSLHLPPRRSRIGTLDSVPLSGFGLFVILPSSSTRASLHGNKPPDHGAQIGLWTRSLEHVSFTTRVHVPPLVIRKKLH